MRISAIIPTFNRSEHLVATLEQLLELARPPEEIIVVDQTREHPAVVLDRLTRLADRDAIRWLRRRTPSITGAMNAGAVAASGDVLLFLDDDVRIPSELVSAHAHAHERQAVAIVAGRVLQPWHEGVDGEVDACDSVPCPDSFPFHSRHACEVQRFIGCNVSMRRHWVLRAGGFDENFRGAAYRFEADFAARVLAAGGRIVFEPDAFVHHLHSASGGSRTFGDQLSVIGPWHSAGRWYYLMRHPRTPGLVALTLNEARQCVLARSHLRRPWRILPSLIAEVAGLACAVIYAVRGPQLTLSCRSVS